jgi:uncharacterized membrane protein
MWKLFGIVVTLMAAFSGYLLFVQAYRIGAFCQYCLISAGTSTTLFIIFLISMLVRRRSSVPG